MGLGPGLGLGPTDVSIAGRVLCAKRFLRFAGKLIAQIATFDGE